MAAAIPDAGKDKREVLFSQTGQHTHSAINLTLSDTL